MAASVRETIKQPKDPTQSSSIEYKNVFIQAQTNKLSTSIVTFYFLFPCFLTSQTEHKENTLNRLDKTKCKTTTKQLNQKY